MNGQVLDYSAQSNEGLISGADGQRYKFSGAEWKIDAPPARGMRVDFETQDKSAVGIYRALGAGPIGLPGTKTKATATLLGMFLGGFGAHKFYMGSWGWGIVYLVTFWLYIPFVVALVEVIHYVLMTDDEFYEKLAQFESSDPGPGPFGFFW